MSGRSKSGDHRALEGSDSATPKRAGGDVLHDLNNPLSFLLANQVIEQEHAAALGTLVEALLELELPAVDALLERYSAVERATELIEILDDNGSGLQRLHDVARQLRSVILERASERNA